MLSNRDRGSSCCDQQVFDAVTTPLFPHMPELTLGKLQNTKVSYLGAHHRFVNLAAVYVYVPTYVSRYVVLCPGEDTRMIGRPANGNCVTP